MWFGIVRFAYNQPDGHISRTIEHGTRLPLRNIVLAYEGELYVIQLYTVSFHKTPQVHSYISSYDILRWVHF
jgi:hypothetical protein